MGISQAKALKVEHLVELQNLESCGVLVDDEYKMEKEHIMNQLQQLKSISNPDCLSSVTLYVKIV